MKFANKVFLFAFLMAVALSQGVTWVSRSYMRQKVKDTYVSKYSLLSETLAHTLKQLESNAEGLMYSAARVVAVEDERFGLLPLERLIQLRDELGITHIFVIDPKGTFIRSTNEDPSLIPNLYSFCAEYKNLFVGQAQSMATPIIPPRPEPKPYKFLTLPNRDRTRLIHVGLRVDFIGGTLTKALQTDPTVTSLNLYAPDGTSLGKFSRNGFEVSLTKENLPGRASGLVETESDYRFFTKVQSAQPRCCQCDVSAISRNGEYYYVLESRVSKSELQAALASIERFFLIVTASALLLSFLLARIVSRTLVQRLEQVIDGIRAAKDAKSLGAELQVSGRDEIALLATEFNGLLKSLSAAQSEIVQSKRQAAVLELARQVAHDIRSPLAALDVTVSRLETDVSEDSRRMIRSAAGRIRDITNDLIKESRRSAQNKGPSRSLPEVPVLNLLSSLVEQVVSEKRLQLSSKKDIEIEALLGKESYGLFVEVQGVELKRVLSNLIDNAVEALPGAGKVTLHLSAENKQIVLRVADTGKGVPEEVLGRLGERGFTYDKVGGSGLGLHHARSAIERWGGQLSIRSTLGAGTTVEIHLPQASLPEWLAPGIELIHDETALMLDDDRTMHESWDQLLAPYVARGLRIVHFTDAEQASGWLADHPNEKVRGFIDQDLRQARTGLDFIEQQKLADRSILVTGQYSDPAVQQGAVRLGVKILPKDLVGQVSIAFTAPPGQASPAAPPAAALRVLVIDDDKMIWWAWDMQKASLGLAELRTFPSMEACETAGLDYGTFDLAFVDVRIPETTWPLDVTIRHLKSRGVKRVFIASGEPDLEKNVLAQEADGIAETKVPKDLTAYAHSARKGLI